MRQIRRVYVANRGEIAVRIIGACRALGIETVLGVSEADRDSLGAKLADRVVCIGPASAAHSYLSSDILLTAALGTGCDAVHPGYGFLSERAVFQRACVEAGLTFIGPSAEAIESMGDKLQAIAIARRAGVPVVPGSGMLIDIDQARSAAAEIGYPCLLKASAGGGGRGMRVVRSPSDLDTAYRDARAEAKAAFGDGTVYLEKFIERARHIEIQVLGDMHGNVVHLFERDCTVQRRHQKIIEEAPSPTLSETRRTEMAEAAVSLARQVGYQSAGTIEFVFDVEADRFYFLEMNTRIQVEHPVTEMLTGVDLIGEQMRVAAGWPLSVSQEEIQLRGHVIECRINAEDPTASFRPSPGKLEQWSLPYGEGIRIDTHCYEGYSVPVQYDSLLAKVITHGDDRTRAIELMSHTLARARIRGVSTTVGLSLAVFGHEDFRRALVTTNWLENEFLRAWEPA